MHDLMVIITCEKRHLNYLHRLRRAVSFLKNPYSINNEQLFTDVEVNSGGYLL